MGQDISISADIKVIHERVERGAAASLDGLISTGPITVGESGKVCVIFCNSYDNTPQALGDSAINDGIMTYREMIERGYKVYLYHDASKCLFKETMTNALKIGADQLVIYYIGHGKQVVDVTRDEPDTYDECVVCSDGLIADDELSKMIMTHNKTKKLVLISDCCHSGSIYDLTSRPDIIAIGACKDDQTAKQDWIEHKGNGIFTYYFWKYLPQANDNAGTLKSLMGPKLAPYRQHAVITYPFTTELL